MALLHSRFREVLPNVSLIIPLMVSPLFAYFFFIRRAGQATISSTLIILWGRFETGIGLHPRDPRENGMETRHIPRDFGFTEGLPFILVAL